MHRFASRLAARQRGRAELGPLSCPEELPIAAYWDEIAEAVTANQVVVVAGETGSGKTTQLPKICLSAGRGVAGMIGHTQPRRIAARSVAERIAAELGTPLGGAVGYQVRFTGHVGEATLIKLMTDGILLAETQRDRALRAYDTIIIDEAHERSLNIDFLLGYLGRLLPRREDLKLVITSATIDPHRFAEHFGGAPVIEVHGRTYPVQVRYRPMVEQVDTGDPTTQDSAGSAGAAEVVRDQVQAICDAVDELCAHGPGDILVFLSGEREIRDTADALRRVHGETVEILPLYARLSTAEQQRIFAAHPLRRIVLATNVAETSLTVPGIHYVVDPGTARISRYSQRLKVQRLPIEAISRASADQRAGRCGRTADGICIRLYDEDDYLARAAFTEPEILRTNLASVILQLAALDLGEVEAFPFVDPPDRRAVADGVALLQELGAFDPAGAGRARLTPLGRRLAALPIDPRLGRMILASQEFGCVREVLVIAAALSIQDPREYPADRAAAATASHARFRNAADRAAPSATSGADRTVQSATSGADRAAPSATSGADRTVQSDFLTYLRLWDYLRERQDALSSNQFRRLCRAEFLNYLRVREWQDLESQLRQVARGMGAAVNTTESAPDHIHQALLHGLLSHLGQRDQRDQRPIEREQRGGRRGRPEYAGARGARFALHPASVLARRNPDWVMVAELVETSRLFGRVAAPIRPEWAERAGAHLVRRSYSEPHWDAGQAAAMAYEKVSLYGLPVIAARKVHYGRIDPALARELFVRHALVEGDWHTRHAFFQHNQALREQVAALEERSRRRDLAVDDETVFAFYNTRIPLDVVSGRHFDRWWREQRRTQPQLLDLTAEMLVRAGAAAVDAAAFPDWWPHPRLRLSYQFEPGAAADGVSVHVPLAVLAQPDALAGAGFDWQVPGLREELVTAWLRSLPKALRRSFVPAADYAADFLRGADPSSGPLLDALGDYLRRLGGVVVSRSDWRSERVPAHLRPTFRVEDDHGQPLGESKDLAELAAQLAPASAQVLAEATADATASGLTAWTPGTLARVIRARRAGHEVTAYPALVAGRDSVSVAVFPTEAQQAASMREGTRALLLLEVPTPIPMLSRRLSNQVKLNLTRYPYAKVPDLLEDAVAASVDALVDKAGGPAFDDDGYARLRECVRAELLDATVELVTQVERVVSLTHEVRERLAGAAGVPALSGCVEDVRTQLFELVGPGFVTATGWPALAELPRYLRAVLLRLERAPANPARDRANAEQVAEVRGEYDNLLRDLPAWSHADPQVRRVRFMLEELRVSYFAAELRTAYPVSAARIYKAIDQLYDQLTASP